METTKLKDLSFEAMCSIIAKVIHSANRAYVDALGGRAVNLTWEEIREEERQGLIKAISSMIINPQTPSVSHEQWCLAREKDGWTKDVKYDYNRKTTPNLVPYDQLPLEEQFKDHLYMGLASIFYGSLEIEDMPEVQAARKIIVADFDKQSEEEDKLAAEEEIDPVDRESTMILMEKLQAAQAELDRLEAEQNAKDEEKEAFANGEQDGEFAAVKTAAAARDAAEVDPLADVKNYPDASGKGPDQVNNGVDKTYKPVMDNENVAIEDGVGSGEIKETPELPIPLPGDEPDTAKEVAEEAVGKDNVAEVPEAQAPKPNLPGKTVGPPKAKKPAKKKSSK